MKRTIELLKKKKMTIVEDLVIQVFNGVFCLQM